MILAMFQDQIREIDVGRAIAHRSSRYAGQRLPGGLRLPIPPPTDQWEIVDHLDRETSRIDALIAQKRRVAELLVERLTTVTWYALFGGIADSVLRRHPLKVKTGATPPADELAELAGDELPWHSPGDIGDWHALESPKRGLQARACDG